MNDCAIARATGIPRATVRDWRSPRYVKKGRTDPRFCPRCADVPLPWAAYAYLLGMYLGDGMIAEHARGVKRLSIYCDSRYPVIVQEIAEAIEAVVPGKPAGRALHPRDAMVIVSSYWTHWPCLFPQHGRGMKHQRPIHLAAWQQEIVNAHHKEFLRGLIHSDGCRHINRVWHGDKAYEYTRYSFSNASDDIRALFCASCDALGIPWRRMNARNISVARREGVAALDEFVGPKR